MKIYKDGKVIKDSKGLYDGGLLYDRHTNKRRKDLPVYNIPFFGPSVSAKDAAKRTGKSRPPYMLERLTEELSKDLGFKKQKEPTWNINNPLKGPAKVAKNVGMFGGAIGIALINGLINDVFGALAREGTMDESIRANTNRDKSKDFDIRRIFFPNKFKK